MRTTGRARGGWLLIPVLSLIGISLVALGAMVLQLVGLGHRAALTRSRARTLATVGLTRSPSEEARVEVIQVPTEGGDPLRVSMLKGPNRWLAVVGRSRGSPSGWALHAGRGGGATLVSNAVAGWKAATTRWTLLDARDRRALAQEPMGRRRDIARWVGQLPLTDHDGRRVEAAMVQ